MADNNNQNQHYVPQFILRRFHSDEGRLHVYDKWSRRSFVSSTRNVAAEKGFYDIEINDTIVTLEPVMCEIENAAISALNAMTDDEALTSVTDEQRKAVAYFFGTQVMRTRSARDMLKQMQEGFRKGATAHARPFASNACSLMADAFGWGLEKERPPLAGM